MSLTRLFSLLAWLLAAVAVTTVVLGAPHWYRLAALEFHPEALPEGRSPTWTLGSDELAARSADSAHVRVERDDGEWHIGNVSATKAVLHGREGSRIQPLRSWALHVGDRLTLGELGIGVLAIGDALMFATEVVGSNDRVTWRWDGRRLSRDGARLPRCGETTNWFARNPMDDSPWRAGPLWLGGRVHCENRVGIRGVAPLTVRIERDTDDVRAWRISYARGAVAPLPEVRIAPTGDHAEAFDLRERSVQLRDGDALVVGYTHFTVRRPAVALNGTAELTLEPRARSMRVAPIPHDASVGGDGVTAPGALVADWQPLRQIWVPDGPFVGADLARIAFPLLLGGVLGAVLGFLLVRRLFGQRSAIRWTGIAAGAVTGAAVVLLRADATPMTLLVALLLALAALALWAWPTPSGRDGSAISYALRALTVLLVGMGLASLALLGLGAAESHWVRHGMRFSALVALLFPPAVLLSIWLRERPQRLRLAENPTQWALWGLGALALLGLFLQFAFGDEGGVANLQPFELAKLAFVAITALAMTQRIELVGMHRGIRSWRLWVSVGMPVVILAVMMMFALALLRDFSPFVLLAGAGFALLWAYLVARFPERAGWVHGAALLGVVLVSVGLVWLKAHPQFAAAIPQGERLRVWAQPELFPHSGYQVRMAERFIRDGGWWGSWHPQFGAVFSSPLHWLGTGVEQVLPMNSVAQIPGVGNGRVMTLPAVQDDFALAFALNRFGAAWGVLLAGLQGLLIGLLVWVAVRVRDGYRAKQDFALRLLAWLGYFTLIGGAGLLATHFLVSWGTNLQFLPVMGQPMPLLSSGGSHLAWFVAPLLIFATILEEGHGHD